MKFNNKKLMIVFIVVILLLLIRLSLFLVQIVAALFGRLDGIIEDIFTYYLNPIGSKLVRWARI